MVLVACEFSSIVRDAFRRRGHAALSCDLEPAEVDGPHYQGDVRDIIHDGWDMMIAHPPCTYLASSGRRWWRGREDEQEQAIDFVRFLLSAPISRIALENPIGRISTAIRKPDQIVQPWWFGHPETKATCLWLKNLPCLVPANVVEGNIERIHRMPASWHRSKDRSRTYSGVAEAMAEQWG